MEVMLDSNIYRHDLTLDGGKFRLLFNQAAQGRFHLVLPEVVAREVTELYRREINTRFKELEKFARRLKSLRIPVSEQEPIDMEVKAAEFRGYLESKIFEAGGEVVQLPEVSHDHLVNKAIRRRKPFSGKGAGYRDALIWQTAAGLISGEKTVALITDNYKDFAAADGETIHADLIAELEEAGGKAESVLLYRDLDSFLKAWVPVEEAALQRVRDLLGDEAKRARLEDALATLLGQFPLPDEGRGFLGSLSVSSEGAWIETFDALESVEATNAYSLSDGDASVELTVEAAVTVDFLAHKGDLYSAEQMYDLGDEIDPPFHIYDYDYNDWMAAAQAPMNLSLSVEATFSAEPEELDDIEIIDIDQA